MALPEPGSPFGAYVVEHPVGQGGFGAVYRARDTRLDRPVALKVLLPAEVSDPESVTRFLREARLAAALEHPNIVRILDVGSIDGTPYIAMEWIEGTTLRRAKVARPVELLATIAETLAFAHEHGIVHRDLKPANIMVDRDERPKLVDFGIAKRIANPTATFATRDGVVLGTPHYMAPEQELTSAVDARADQWAWGAIAYELLTGERPTRPALAHAALDERLGAVVLRALATAPSDRFPSLRDLLAAWDAARRPLTVTPTPAPVPMEPRSAAPARWRLFVISAVSVAALGLVISSIVTARRPMNAYAPAVTSSVVPAIPSSPPPPPTVAPQVAPQDEEEEEPPPSASVEKGAPPAARPPAGARTRVAKGARMFMRGHSGDAERDWAAVDAALKAIADRCFKGVRVPRGTSVVLYVDFAATGEVTKVTSTTADVTPPAIPACMIAAVRKSKFAPGRNAGNFNEGYVPEVD